MLASIGTQVFQPASSQQIQHGFAPKIVNARIVRVSFFNGKVVDAQNRPVGLMKYFVS
ncbi:hypothetical protein GCM10010912_14780 [Paenibacillus albidus]|uniref:Uncharacterized protein n=1 Tax=Paenibacillus albidus TaxID=2041023 RepID=A0A917C3U3_9BACL|nr:hypothetical protein GCM10010912_14780 [Paenibacillus albidus]